MSFSKSLKSSSEQLAHSERTDDSPQKPRVEFSDFGDGACGEPAFAQHIALDFTPEAELDNEISQKKICDFWKFINNSPDIKNLMVKPERCAITKPPAAPEVPGVVKEEREENVVSMAKTACSMLEIVEEKELITRAFEGKMPQSHCSLGSREYKENEDIRQKKIANRDSIICKCPKICKPCPVKKPSGAAPLSKAKQLCTKLQEWDDKHPKSMEPPGHPPALQHCIIQRQMISDDTTSRLYQHSDSTRYPPSDGTSNPRPLETLSDFRDGSCGEPLFAQQVVIDFTPNEEDNSDVQKKVCSFWQFINNSPEIQNLKVKAEKELFTGNSKTEIATESINSEIEVTNVVKAADRQAVEMLGFAEEKSLIDTIFEAKLPQLMCSSGSREYKQIDDSTQRKKKEKKKHVCKCTPCLNPKCRNKQKTPSDELSSVRILSRKMNEWDAKHPKSMDPPGHAPPLHHCMIQRQTFPRPL